MPRDPGAALLMPPAVQVKSCDKIENNDEFWLFMDSPNVDPERFWLLHQNCATKNH